MFERLDRGLKIGVLFGLFLDDVQHIVVCYDPDETVVFVQHGSAIKVKGRANQFRGRRPARPEQKQTQITLITSASKMVGGP